MTVYLEIIHVLKFTSDFIESVNVTVTQTTLSLSVVNRPGEAI